MRGGILADEMGMGKTLQTIALMIAHRSRERGAATTRDAGGRYHGGNLVIVPVVAMVQWRTELLRFTPPGYFSIYFYHGPKRESDPKVLAKYDIVLTTYSTLEYDYRIATQDQKVALKMKNPDHNQNSNPSPNLNPSSNPTPNPNPSPAPN